MPIRPIDVVKSQEASQIRHAEIQRMANAQAQSSKNVQDGIQEDRTRTSETAESDNNEYRYDPKEKGNNDYYGSRKQKKDKKKKDSKDETSGPEKSGGIDILI